MIAGLNTIALTPRELDVLRLLGSGCTYEQAALRLGISTHTVVTHTKNAYRKLQVHTAAGAVVRAMQLGLLSFPQLRDGALGEAFLRLGEATKGDGP